MTTREEIIELTANRFYKEYAATTAARVIELGAVAELYALATDVDLEHLPAAKRRNTVWRSAYTLEYIYFNHYELFSPFREQFIVDFTHCKNPSAMRSFAKVMADMLTRHTPTQQQMEVVAQCAAEWVADPKVKVAVKVWSMSILRTLRPHIAWIDDVWEDMETLLKNNSTPAIEVRLKRGWR